MKNKKSKHTTEWENRNNMVQKKIEHISERKEKRKEGRKEGRRKKEREGGRKEGRKEEKYKERERIRSSLGEDKWVCGGNVFICYLLSSASFLFFFYQDGGEMYFSDVYVDSIISEEARKSEVLWGMFH